MWRTQAILSILREDLGGLEGDDGEALARARRRALLVVSLDWAAILVLVLSHDRGFAQLTLDGGEQTLFTLGILTVAAHSGFRLAQWLQLGAIDRVCAELEARSGE